MIKYDNLRDQIQNGDIILYHGTSILDTCISYFDNKAYFSHAGIVWKVGTGDNYRLLTLEMYRNGMNLDSLSNTMASHSHSDFCVVRPIIDSAKINDIMQIELNAFDGGVKYDFGLMLAIAIYKKTGVNFKWLYEKNSLICSQLVQQFSINLGLTSFDGRQEFTPQDVIRYAKPSEFHILFDDEPKIASNLSQL